MRNNSKSGEATHPPYFVSATNLAAKDSLNWVITKATTIEGAKRLATKLPRGIAATARVAIKKATGEFEVVAICEDFSRITRRRPTWKILHRTVRAPA